MLITITLDYFRQYCSQAPPPAKSFNDEINRIRENLKGYPEHKKQYLQFYINKNPWIKFYLYLDQSSLKIIKDIESSAIDMAGHDLQNIIMENIDDEIQKAGGIINFLKNRITCYCDEACGCLLITDDNEYYKLYYESNDTCESLDFCMWFMANLMGIIEEIEAIEGDSNNDRDIIIPSVDGTEKLFDVFQSNRNQQRLYKFLLELQQSEDMIVDNWDKVLSGDEKIIFKHGNRNILSLMQVLQKNGIITNHGTRANEHANRIIKIFQSNKQNKNGDYEYNFDSLVNEYSSSLNKDDDGNFYHEKNMKYYENKLKKISK